MPAPNPPALGGIDLASLAAGSQAETTRRTQGAQGSLAASLASMLAEQGGMLSARSAAQGRDQSFQRAQAMLAESLTRRAQGIQEADALAKAQGNAENWYQQQRFQTDENIRQAKAIGQFERQWAGKDEKRKTKQAKDAERPRLSDFGPSSINPFRGQALLDTPAPERGWLPDTSRTVSPTDLAQTSDLIGQYGADPNALIAALRDYYGPQRSQAASVALWNLGYGV